MPESHSADNPPTQRPWLVLGIFCVGFFMALLDGTVINIAVPTLIEGFGASYDQVLWVIDAYLLVFSVLLITTGRLGDTFGYRRLFLAGIVTFTVASALCGFAGSPEQLIAGRVLQGLGAALLFPQVISSILAIFPPQQRGKAFGVFGAIAGLAPILGPIAGGFVLAHFGWRWIFFINLPIGVIAALLALVFAPELRVGRAHAFDVVGVVLATAGLTGIVFGLIEGPRYGWGTIAGPVGITSVIVGGVAFLVLVVLWQHNRPGEPLMPLKLFTGRNFAVGNWIGFVFQLGMIGMAFVLVLYLQMALGFTALETGFIMLPNAILTAVGSAFAGRLADEFGGRFVLALGMVLLAAGLVVVVAMTGPNSSAWQLLPGLLIIGIASGATFAPLQQVTMDGVDPALAGAASGVSSTTRQIGGVLGTAVLGAVLAAVLNASLRNEATSRAARLPEGLREQFVQSAITSGHRFGPPAVPNGLPPAEAAAFTEAGRGTFAAAFANAMDVVLLASAAVLVLAALCCVLLKTREPERIDRDAGAAAVE
ncbi:drug resistance transporter, EmrB/QacA subfamily [Saccharopolyspora kobensis]|uniref:Drug resistance transporter, EmrB/QacA subfamily n=1 Tax=Saccharopolyspora kobensis TaxID=146035 RepID=A0A1H6EJ36_9PSEU|nr:DHA2 family efflux MFS transporter permease subunit [Saccharopolyspora kobensis]SEG96734.1 drug resistance transporter, EmrB/QacA subfamily [Saccharopolyspora kobensis]SFF04138.1 drug resistance transporter, EmrB/QacA subfamily [Saccharopolyspora kobensis]